MNDGKKFEQDWKESFKKTNYFYLRLRDTAKWLEGANTTFTPSNPCDSILYTPPFLWLLELKSTKGAGISFNPKNPDKKPIGEKTKVMIKHNQVKSLLDASNYQGILAGFIFNYRPRQLKNSLTDNVTYFVHILDFIKFAKESEKSSINQNDCEKIGIKINCELKKIRYKYDIENFVYQSINYYMNKGYIPKNYFNNWKE